MGRPLLRREGRTSSLGCVRRRRVYGSLTGGTAAKRSSARTCRFCTFRRDKGRGTGREVRPRLPARRMGPVWLRCSLLDKIGRSDSCRSAKGGAGVLCGGDVMRSGVVISVLMGEKTVLARGFAVQFIAVKQNVARRFLLRNEIWNGYPLLRNGIGRAALRGINRLGGGEIHRRGGRRDARARRPAV